MKEVADRKYISVGLILVFMLLYVPGITTSKMPLDIDLPPPMYLNISIEKALCCRMSVRSFTEEPITDEELSTILWAAYGMRNDGNRTISPIDDVYSVHLYVIREDGVYTYDPYNHRLVFYKIGDYRHIAQWRAPILIGMVWNTTLTKNENLACALMGEIGQNIQFTTYALGLGSVVNANFPQWNLGDIGLPSNEIPKIIIPLGHPKAPYQFVYVPMWVSFLPRIHDSQMNLTTVITNRTEVTEFNDKTITRRQLSRLVWSSYGYSPYLDISKPEQKYVTRHRTVPSAHGYYPLQMYVVTKSGVFLYIPGLTYVDTYGLPIVTLLLKIQNSDVRTQIAHATQGFVDSAPLIIISVLDLQKTIKWDDLSDETVRWLWFYEAGASAYNVELEATALGLFSNIVSPNNTAVLQSVLQLHEEQIPLLVVPVGNTN